MLVKPSMEKLLGKVSSRYILTILAAKRARQLVDGANPMAESDSPNQVTMACEEIAAGKVLPVRGLQQVKVPLRPEIEAEILREEMEKREARLREELEEENNIRMRAIVNTLNKSSDEDLDESTSTEDSSDEQAIDLAQFQANIAAALEAGIVENDDTEGKNEEVATEQEDEEKDDSLVFEDFITFMDSDGQEILDEAEVESNEDDSVEEVAEVVEESEAKSVEEATEVVEEPEAKSVEEATEIKSVEKEAKQEEPAAVEVKTSKAKTKAKASAEKEAEVKETKTKATTEKKAVAKETKTTAKAKETKTTAKAKEDTKEAK